MEELLWKRDGWALPLTCASDSPREGVSLPLEYRARATGTSYFFSCRMPCGRITSDTNGESGSPSLTVLRVKREVRGGSYGDGSLGNVVRPLVESPAAWAYASERAAQPPPLTPPKGGGGASAVAVPITGVQLWMMADARSCPFLLDSCADSRGSIETKGNRSPHNKRVSFRF
jgi:hypothetical protein